MPFGKKHTEETKRKMSEARKAIWADPETKARLSGFMKGVKRSKQSRKNMLGRTGKHPNSQKQKEAVSRSSLRLWSDPEFRKHRSSEMSEESKKRWEAGLYDHIKQGRGKGGHHNGKWMRSSWELAFAARLDEVGIDWSYEPRRFVLSNGRSYRPDFLINSIDCFVEIKGHWYPKAQEKFDLFRREHPSVDIIVIGKEIWKLPLNDFLDTLSTLTGRDKSMLLSSPKN